MLHAPRAPDNGLRKRADGGVWFSDELRGVLLQRGLKVVEVPIVFVDRVAAKVRCPARSSERRCFGLEVETWTIRGGARARPGENGLLDHESHRDPMDLGRGCPLWPTRLAMHPATNPALGYFDHLPMIAWLLISP